MTRYLSNTLPAPNIETGQLLPNITPGFAQLVKNAGHQRIGVGLWIVNPAGEILVQAHEKSDKTEPGALGPMTETIHWRSNGKHKPPEIEQPPKTIARGVHKELGVADPNALGLHIRRTGGYLLHACPVGVDYPGQTIMGLWTAGHVNHEVATRLTANFEPTPEVREIGFMTVDEILATKANRFRFAIRSWFPELLEYGMLAVPGSDEVSPLILPNPTPLPNGKDTTFSDNDYLVQSAS